MNIEALPVAPSLLGESPLWHPVEQALYWCDIPGHRLNRYDPATGAHRSWAFDTDVACCAPRVGGGLLLARRDGIWAFDPEFGASRQLAAAPYDMRTQRFNDGKVDAAGRFWVGTIHEPRDGPGAALYRWAEGRLDRVAGDVTVSNGLAWSPDQSTLYWADTPAHVIYGFDFDATRGLPSNRRVFARFPMREPRAPLADYGGRPDGAIVDAEGGYWIAMFEGSRLLRLSPTGEVLQTVSLPVRCPTMPCLGGPDLRTLYITTSREHRSADELAAMPWSGRVLSLRVDVPGLPANLAE